MTTDQEAAATMVRASSGARLAVAAILTGVAAGLGGMILALLLHAVQHLAYGYDLARNASPETFLQGVTGATPHRRLVALAAAGAVAGFGWWAVQRFGRRLVSVRAAVGTDAVAGPAMPFSTTLAHAVLQILTVALGSPLGREVAPREVGALFAGRLAGWFGLTPEELRMIVACGAGGGLAAVYNVPIGGALFTLEVLLVTMAPRAIVLAIATSVIAALTAWIGLGDAHQYVVPAYAISPSLVVWAMATGPVFGVAAYLFRRMVTQSTAHAATGWHRIPWSLAVFIAMGVLASRFPALPGNGRGPIQLAFDGQLGLMLAAELLALKLVGIAGALRAGASGGVLTPGLTIGALIALLLGGLWNLLLPGAPAGAYAIVGSAAFLASSMNMPLTALALGMEFTGIGHDFVVPIALAIAGSAAARHVCEAWAREPSRLGRASAAPGLRAGIPPAFSRR